MKLQSTPSTSMQRDQSLAIEPSTYADPSFDQFNNAQAKALVLLIKNNIEQGNSKIPPVLNILDRYNTLPRHLIGSEQLIELKFRMQHWRNLITERLLAKNWTEDDLTVRNNSISILNFINVKQSSDALKSLWNKIQHPSLSKAFQLYLKSQAQGPLLKILFNEQNDITGPNQCLDIKPIVPTKHLDNNWRTNPELSRYHYTQEGIVFRGIELKPGDIMITNLNIDSDGIYSALCSPKSFASHAGFFVMLTHGNKTFPAVLEIYQHGLRAIPANVFLSEKFSSYTEVYRIKTPKKLDYETLNTEGKKLLQSVKGYNFNTEDQNPHYLTCAQLGRQLYQNAGIVPITAKSAIEHPQIQTNLAKFGVNYKSVLAPMNFAIDQRMELVGTVDNNQLTDSLAHMLVKHRFFDYVSTKEINLLKLPKLYQYNLWSVNKIQNNHWFGCILRKAKGFNKDNFPRGPEGILALAKVIEPIIGKINKQTAAFINKNFPLDSLSSYQSLRNEPLMDKFLQHKFAPINNFFD